MKSKIPFYIPLLLGLFMGFVMGVSLAKTINERYNSSQVLKSTAKRLSTNADWNEIRKKTYCISLKPGLSRLDVYKQISIIDGFKVFDMSNSTNLIETYQFNLDEVSFELKTIAITYNSENKVKLVQVQNTAVFDYRLDIPDCS